MLTSKPQSSSSPKVADASDAKREPSSLKWLVGAVNAIVDDATLDGNEKLVLLVLARHCNGFGVCWPSRALLLERSGCSRGTVKRALQSLEKKGRLKRTLRAGRHGNDSNLFHVVPSVQGTQGQGDHSDPRKDLSGCLFVSSSQQRSPSPPPKEGGLGGGKGQGSQTAERAEAVHIVTACPNEQRRVRSAKWADGQFARLENALLAKGLSIGLVVRAAEQYATQTGAWEPADDAPINLELGLSVIADDVAGWAARLERRAKPVARPPATRELVTAPNGRLVEREVTVCMLSPAQLAAQARLLSTLSPMTADAKVAPERSSPEQTAILGGIVDVAEGGSR